MRNKSGFTLMELMVVIAIIGIVSAIAIPNMVGRFQQYRFGQGARDIWNALQSSRMLAIKENTDVMVDFDPDGNGTLEGNYLVYVDDGTTPRVYEAAERIVKQGLLPAGVTLSDVDFGAGDWICFDKRGLPENDTGASGGTITLSNGGGQNRQIVLSVTGNSRILTP